MADEITLDAPETRLERFLAAAAGMDGITLDEPETRIEKYLYKIAQGSGGVPAVEDADKGKFLHANESTGDLEWATPSGGGGGGGGGVLVCHLGDNDALDHTWQEIHDAPCAVIYGDGTRSYLVSTDNAATPYTVQFMSADASPQLYVDTLYADSADDYPEYRDFGGGN